MTSTTLLDYLTLPNPGLDCSGSLTGGNTFNAKWDLVTGLEDWADFTYENLMQLYGRTLTQQVPMLPGISPPLTKLAKKIVTEKTFKSILERAIMPNVSAALRVAWPLYYSTRDSEDCAEIGKGDLARRGITEEDDRYYADWAGIRESETTEFGYKNLCPGETKLSSKWSTSKEGRRRTDFPLPFHQIQTYCGRQWGVRHGYIITTEELVVIRVTRESVGPGLAASRAARNTLQQTNNYAQHSRTISAETMSSDFQALSLDTGSSYKEDANPDIEYRPLLFKSIPWSAAGRRRLTVKLALWYLHMETKKDLSVQPAYPSQDVLSLPTFSRNTKEAKDKGKGPSEKVLWRRG